MEDLGLIASAQAGVSSPETLARDLYEYHKTAATLPTDEACDFIRAEGVCTKALDRLNELELDGWNSLTGQRGLVILPLLAGFVIAEGGEECFWRKCRSRLRAGGLKSQSQDSYYISSEDRDSVAWLGRLSGALIGAHFLQEVSQCADEALKSALGFCGLKTEISWTRGIYSTSSNIALVKAFRFKRYPHTSPSLFDQGFGKLSLPRHCERKEFEGFVKSHQQHLALLSLSHPTRPSADMALQWLRGIEQTDTDPLWYITKSDSTAVYDFAIASIVSLLRRQGRVRDASWALDLARLRRRRLPELRVPVPSLQKLLDWQVSIEKNSEESGRRRSD